MVRKDYSKTLEYNRNYNKTHKEVLKKIYKKYKSTEKGKELSRQISQRYAAKNREKLIEKCRLYRLKEREKVLSHYGDICVCCNENDIRFLTVDHIDNSGNEHRRLDKSAKNIYHWLIMNGFPKGFQILCFNCNLAKKIYKECPHKIPKESELTRLSQQTKCNRVLIPEYNNVDGK